jgi:hypothetical protein
MPSSPREDATVKIRAKRGAGLLVGIAVVLGLLTSPASAVTLGADWASVAGDITGGVVGTLTNNLIGSDSLPHGVLVTNAYKNGAGDLYTYQVQVTPHFGGISMIGTGFAVSGLTGSAGWSFADATAAGTASASSVFEMTAIGNVLQWTRNLFVAEDTFWNVPDGSGNYPAITFFYQSLLGPNATGTYNFQNSVPGSGVGVAPALRPAAVPEPATLLLLTGGLAGAALWARLGRRQDA